MSENHPLVSIVMPAHNACKTIANAINSVKMQSYQKWELVVVDDYSNDETVSIVNTLARLDDRIKVLTLSKNSGQPAYPRNVAIQQSKGDLIAFLDADDEWMPDKLKNQIYFMHNLSAAISCTGYSVMDLYGNDIASFTPPKTCCYQDMLRHNTIGCLTAIYDVRILGKRYFPICGHEDYALWLSILREGYKVYGLQEQLSRYRLTPKSVSSNKLKVLPFFWNIYKNQEGFSYLMSLLFCLRYAWHVIGKYN